MGNGLLGINEDPITLGLLQAAAALATPQRQGGGFGPAMMAFPQALSQAQQARRQRETDAMQREIFGMKRSEFEDSRSERERQRAAAEQQQQHLQSIIATLPQDQQALARAMPSEFLKTLMPQGPQKPLIVPQGAAVFDPQKPDAPLFQAPPKPESEPADVRAYQFAVQQGFKGDFQSWLRAKAEASRPVTNVTTGATNVQVGAESAYGKGVSSAAADRDVKRVESAQNGIENIAKIDRTLDLLETGDALTGFGADFRKNVERARALLMKSQRAGKTVSDTELLDAMLGSDVFPQIGALGIGARGLDTPAEREFLRQVMTGTISMNKDTLIRMTKIRRDIQERELQRFNESVQGGELDRFFQYSGSPKRPIDIPQRGGFGAQPGQLAQPGQPNNDPLGIRR
jgi:hypothetical protein